MLGIGTRVLVTSGSGRSDRVTLTDDSGTSTLGTVPDGVEVEIVAWRPRRGGDTRYRVVTTGDRVEGWLGAGSLKPRPAPPPPPRPLVAAAPPARVVTSSRAPLRAAAPVAASAASKRTRRGTR